MSSKVHKSWPSSRVHRSRNEGNAPGLGIGARTEERAAPSEAQPADVVHPWSSDGSLTSSERVYLELRKRILSGSLPPRTRLVEVRLADSLSVSRTPVREALKRLTAEGLVTVDSSGGIVVSHLERDDLEEIYAVREVLDGLAARLAAERASATEMEKFHHLMEMMNRSVAEGQVEEIVQGNLLFHDLLHTAAGNERLSKLSHDLGDFVRRFSSESFASEERAYRTLAEHAEIIAAIEQRDPEKAEEMARQHVSSARAFLTVQYLSRSIHLESGTDRSVP